MKEKISNKIEIKSDFGNKDTVLVWLDFGPYSYTNLAITNELSKLREFDFVGIVATKQDWSFFQNQEFVKFKKLYYYPDCYIDKSIFNINDLKKIEEKYELNLWSDVFTERSFYKFWTYFHKFSKEEIFIIIENSIKFFIDILEKFNPKIILMQQGGENISNLLLYRIAKKMGIEILMPNALHLKDHIHISNNLTSDEISIDFEKSKLDLGNKNIKYNKEFLKSKNLADSLKEMMSFDSGIYSFRQKINHYFARLTNEPEPIYKNFGKNKSNTIKNRLDNYFELKKRQKFLDKKTLKIIKKEKFLYFPLQSEPEATILVNTPFYTNQITLIETIAKAIPIDMMLFVKEHPIQKIKLWRSIEDYKKILDIPNVRFFHPNVNSQELLEKSRGIITISGGTGFEALFFQKPVILFGDEHYDILSTVTKIKNMNELPEKIRNALMNFKYDEKEFNRFMSILKKHALPVPHWAIMKDGVSLSSIQRNGEKFDITNLYFEKFLARHSKYFKLIADTIFSRYKMKFGE